MRVYLALLILILLVGPACSDRSEPLPNGLLLSMAVFKKSEHGRSMPQPARLVMLYEDGHGWQQRTIEDSAANNVRVEPLGDGSTIRLT